jgi:hypothetical protein
LHYAALRLYTIRASAILPGREPRYLKVSSAFLCTQTFQNTSVLVTSLHLVISTKIVNTGFSLPDRCVCLVVCYLEEGSKGEMSGKERFRHSGTPAARCKGFYLCHLKIQTFGILLSQIINNLQALYTFQRVAM